MSRALARLDPEARQLPYFRDILVSYGTILSPSGYSKVDRPQFQVVLQHRLEGIAPIPVQMMPFTMV
jgi:hypothetical protein